MLRILEIAWLSIAVISMGFGAFKTITEGFNEGIWFFIFTAVAGMMFSIRRKQRIASEQSEDLRNSQNDQEQK